MTHHKDSAFSQGVVTERPVFHAVIPAGTIWPDQVMPGVVVRAFRWLLIENRVVAGAGSDIKVMTDGFPNVNDDLGFRIGIPQGCRFVGQVCDDEDTVPQLRILNSGTGTATVRIEVSDDPILWRVEPMAPITSDSQQQTIAATNLTPAVGALLAANATANGPTMATQHFTRIRAFATSDQSGTVAVEQSLDGVTWDETLVAPVVGGTPAILESILTLPYVRVLFTNGATAQASYFRLAQSLVH